MTDTFQNPNRFGLPSERELPNRPLRVACTVTFSPPQARRIEEMIWQLNRSRQAGQGVFKNAGDVVFAGLIALDLMTNHVEDTNYKSVFETKS